MHTTAENLKKHGFQALIAENEAEAASMIQNRLTVFKTNFSALYPDTRPVISYGDSLTLYRVSEAAGGKGILGDLREDNEVVFLDGFRKEDPRPEKLKIRREAVLSDFYMTGVNAISREGALYWVDMVGNRVASVSIGAREVILVAGKNKIVPTNADLDPRIRTIAAPENIARHPGFRTPCAKTGVCMNCNSPDRICNVRLLMERCYPAGRITVLLINQELGL